MADALLNESAGILNININQGTDFPLGITWEDTAAGPIDITDYTAKMQVKKQANMCSEALISLDDTNGGGIVLGGVAGTIDISITADVNILTAGSYHYDLELTEPGGSKFKLIRGTFNVISGVTS